MTKLIIWKIFLYNIFKTRKKGNTKKPIKYWNGQIIHLILILFYRIFFVFIFFCINEFVNFILICGYYFSCRYIIFYITIVDAKCPAKLNDGYADWPESEEGQVYSRCYDDYVSDSVERGPYRNCTNGQWSEISFGCYSKYSPRVLQGDCIIFQH